MKTKSKRTEAFTLIEVVMSLGLLTLGLGASMSAINHAIRVASASRSQQTALHEARRQMEIWKANDFNSTNMVAGTYQLVNANHAGQIVVDDLNADMKTISVEVDYETMNNSTNTTINLNMNFSRAIH